MTAISTLHQIVPSLTTGDAVSAHTRRLRRVLRDAGLQSEIFAEWIDPALSGEARPLRELPSPDPAKMALLYHSSIGHPVVDELLRRPDPLVVDYHNLTPVAQLIRWAPDMAHLVGWGRTQMHQLAGRAVLGIGDSPYNTAELAAAGYRRHATVPVLLDLSAIVPRPVPTPGPPSWLFVGRIVPNKAQHDLVLALAWARATTQPDAVLRLVGKPAVPAYWTALERMIESLGLGAAVTLTGEVDDLALEAEFRRATVFLCPSEHEGFGIPLLEAMAHGVPVVAFATAAVPDTVGGAGLVLSKKDPATLATAAHRVTTDAELRAAMVRAGLAQAAAHDAAHVGPRMLASLSTALDLATAG